MIKSHLLYRLSYERTKNGASDRNRTGDNHVGNVMLYQLSYTRLLYATNIHPKFGHFNSGKQKNPFFFAVRPKKAAGIRFRELRDSRQRAARLVLHSAPTEP